MAAADAALQRAIADACLGLHADEELARDLRGFFEARGVAIEDIDAIAAAPRRLAIYRTLVRNGLASVVARVLARTRARMNAAAGGRFDADLALFVDQVGSRSHYLREVPAELLAWAAPRWRADPALPPYLVDLASHELACFVVASCSAAQSPRSAGEVALDRPLAFIESVRLMHYAWAVHELPPDADAAVEPAPRATHLLGYRDPTHAVRWLELTPLASAILERLIEGISLGAAVERACAVHATAPADVLEDIARLLADLGARGVLL